MTRVAITPVAIDEAGYDLTGSADFTTMATGAENGVSFAYSPNDVIVLKNGTAGAAVYTLDILTPVQFSERGLTVPDETVTVPAGETWLYPISSIFKQADGDIYIDCDALADILVLSR